MKIEENITGLRYIGIPTADIEETVLFYTEIGFDVTLMTENPNTGGQVIFMKQKDLLLKAFEEENLPEGAGRAIQSAIQVTDVEDAYDFICKRGLSVLEDAVQSLPYPEEGFRYFTVEGPNGEQVEFTS